MFLTYDEYTNMGYSQIDKADFPLLERHAAQYIRANTMNRAGLGRGFDDELKEATALIAEQLLNESHISGGNAPVAGITFDGLSISKAVGSSETEAKMAAQMKRSILERQLFFTGWLYVGMSTCRPAPIFPTLPKPKPPTDGGDEGNNGGDEEDVSKSKRANLYPLSDNFKAGFDADGYTLTFTGGTFAYDCADGQGELTIAGKTINFVHAQHIILDIAKDAEDRILQGTMPTEDAKFTIGYMHLNGGRKIATINGLSSDMWEG